MTPEQRARIAEIRALWVSPSYGYHGDLMYYGEIFRALREWLPRMAVAVEIGTRIANPYRIDLRPMMRLRRWSLQRASPDGQHYAAEAAVPGPMLLARLLRAKADVLIAIEFTLPALLAALASLLTRKRLLLLVEADPANRGASRHPLVRAIKRWAVRRADLIQTNNAGGRRYLIEDLRADPAKVRVAPYLTSRPPGPIPRRAAHRGPLHLLFANSLIARKGACELFAALAQLAPAIRRQVVLTVVGDGPDRERLAHLATGLRMGNRLRFVGRRDYAGLGVFYASADALVIPSLADYRSLAGFEGLGYGLALLSSKYDGATAETVEDGINGFAIDPLDPVTLAARIAALVEDRELLLRMQRASLARYQTHFSLERIAANLAGSAYCVANRLGCWPDDSDPPAGDAYWRAFYRSAGAPDRPSAFARFVAKHMPQLTQVVDLGCGNGRDAHYFARAGKRVIGVDRCGDAIAACQSRSGFDAVDRSSFVVAEVDDSRLWSGPLAAATGPVLLYARFLFHAVDDRSEQRLITAAAERLKTCGGALCVEFRTPLDAGLPKAMPDHFRRYVEPDRFCSLLEAAGLRVTYRREGRGMARYKDEDAHVARIIAEP